MFPSITLQGNILTFDILEKISTGEASHQAAKDYGDFSSNERLRDEIQFQWGQFQMEYKAYQERINRSEDKRKTGITRNNLMVPFLSSLGYNPVLQKSAEVINDRSYAISHKDQNAEGFPIHIVGHHQSLDKKSGTMTKGPHSMIQEYLNHHDNLYALLTNGRYLRLLRDSSVITKLSYLQIDLEQMVNDGLYADFSLLYRLLHVTRMPKTSTDGDGSIMEGYHQDGLESGSRIRSALSTAVEAAILKLGNGLLSNPKNNILHKYADGAKSKDFYGKLLLLIYRTLFLMVIEERELIFEQLPENADDETKQKWIRNRSIYYEGYSLTRLRKLSYHKQLASGRYHDVWQCMINTFKLYEARGIGERIGIAPLSGDLFSTNAISELYQCELSNEVILSVLRDLSMFTNEQGQTIRVNYKSLNVEEFGSIYEGLLDYDPAILPKGGSVYSFSFVEGKDRSTSGSHYTPDELVKPLIDNSLQHLIDDIVAPDALEQSAFSFISMRCGMWIWPYIAQCCQTYRPSSSGASYWR